MLNNMARLPLHTLPAFRTLARLQNLRAAAEQLHLTHSAVSQQLRLLEEQIGFRLFDRNGRRIVLNAAGSAFLRAVWASRKRPKSLGIPYSFEPENTTTAPLAKFSSTCTKKVLPSGHC